MKERMIIAVLAVFVLFLGTGCKVQDKQVDPTSLGMSSPETKPIEVATKSINAKKRLPPREPLITVKATVQAIDSARRLVTLKDVKGKVFDLKVGEEVESLPQMTIGDEVVTKYYEWAAVEIKKTGEREGRVLKKAAATAKPGEGPVGVVREPLTVTATVEEIDHPRTHVTIKQPDGNSTKVFVRSPRYLRDVSVGDQLVITYIEALAISMEKVK